MESEEVGVDGLNGKNFHSSKYKTVPYKIVWKNCSCDREKNLKLEAEGREFAIILR